MVQLVGGLITTRLFQQRQHDQLMNMLNRNLMETLRDQFLAHFSNEAFRRYPGVFANRSQKWRRRLQSSDQFTRHLDLKPDCSRSYFHR